MGETALHKYLKKIGMAFLHNQRCYLIATECHVQKSDRGLDRHPLDRKYIVDVLGLGEKPIYKIHYKNYYKEKIGFDEVFRGIEVKTTYPDFKNGFVCSGLNYHYLLTPMRLVNKSELPKWVGLIEYNKYKVNISFSQDRFNIDGLKVVKKPKFREIGDRKIKILRMELIRRANRTLINILNESLKVVFNEV